MEKPNLNRRQNHHIQDHDQGPGIGRDHQENFLCNTFSSASIENKGIVKNGKEIGSQPIFQQEFNCDQTTNAPNHCAVAALCNGERRMQIKEVQSMHDASMLHHFNNENQMT